MSLSCGTIGKISLSAVTVYFLSSPSLNKNARPPSGDPVEICTGVWLGLMHVVD